MAKDIKPILSDDSSVTNLITDLRQIIDEARSHVASTVNYELTMMYWHVGERINRDILGNERAAYGEQIVATIASHIRTKRV
jgi:hypothetical protein